MPTFETAYIVTARPLEEQQQGFWPSAVISEFKPKSQQQFF
jgi:hypothetical protein